MQKNRGQLNLSFGMIFSIIMIVLFISVAFYAIQKFLGLQSSTQVAKFASDLQNDIDKIWKSSQSSEKIDYFLPSKIRQICFLDESSSGRGANSNYFAELQRISSTGTENLFFYPINALEGLDSLELRNINIAETTSSENPLCIGAANGRVSVRIKKDFSESQVTIAR